MFLSAFITIVLVLPFHWRMESIHLQSTIMLQILMSLCLHISGVILRDSHGVAQVRFVTGNKILRILKKKGMAPDLPEDLYHLIKKAVNIRKHMERNRKVGTAVMLSHCGVPLFQIILLLHHCIRWACHSVPLCQIISIVFCCVS